jgi:hypothetical protein
VILDKLQLVCLRVERQYVHLGLGITVGLPNFTDRIRFVAALRGGLLFSMAFPGHSWPLPKHKTTQIQRKRTQISML